jgi:hypothetical protein
MQKYINYKNVDFGVTKIDCFNLERDIQTGAICWSNGDLKLWASPQFEGEENLVDVQIQYFDENGNEYNSDGDFFELRSECDLEAQKHQYLYVVTQLLKKLHTMEFYTEYYKNIDGAISKKEWDQIVNKLI